MSRDCPVCKFRLRTVRCFDEGPYMHGFSFEECIACGWDDEDERRLEFTAGEGDHSDDVPELKFED